MRRHIYDRLEVTGDLVAAFDPKAADGLEKAVDHLGAVSKGKLVWLMAVTKVKVGNYRWPVNSLLTYEQVRDKSSDEIWKMFDVYTDKHIESVLRARVSFPI
jgi:hypothetical protein